MIGNADALRMVVECPRPHLDPTRGPRSHWPPHPLGPGCLIRGCTHTLGHQIANHRSQDMDCPICGANAEQIPTTIDDVSIVCPTCGEYDVASARSEEHTSELQSHLNLVCRLLLEKKKNNT